MKTFRNCPGCGHEVCPGEVVCSLCGESVVDDGRIEILPEINNNSEDTNNSPCL